MVEVACWNMGVLNPFKFTSNSRLRVPEMMKIPVSDVQFFDLHAEVLHRCRDQVVGNIGVG